MTEVSIVGSPSLDSESIIDIAIDKTPLSTDQARQLTHSIRDASEVIWILIARAHAGKAWRALGYDTWEEYVKSEFNMSRSRSYQLLDQAKVISAIEEAMPEGTNINLTEAAARELRTVLEEAIPEIRKATENLDGEEAVKVTEEILSKYREKAHADIDPVFDNEGESSFSGTSNLELARERETDPIEHTVEQDQQAEEVSYLTQQENTLPAIKLPPILQPESSFQSRPHATGAKGEPNGQPDLTKIRKLVNAAHDIYSSLSALASLPNDISEVIDMMPEERRTMVDNNLELAKENLEKFNKIWQANKNLLDNKDEA
jgi:heat shock protein HspQ